MARQKLVLKLGYRTLRHEISKEDVDNQTFETLMSRRLISQTSVNRLFSNLVKGIHFEAPFVVNYKNKRYRLVDGNHRWEAVCKYLMANPDNRVEVLLNIYDDMSEEDEKSLYTRYNIGKKQTTNDFIQQYKADIPIFKLVSDQTRFPIRVSVYPNVGALSFYRLISAYLASKQARFPGGYCGSAMDFVEVARNLGHSDVAVMSEFIKEYQSAFGPIRNNAWFKGTPFTAVMRIWTDNKSNIKPDMMVDLFRKKLQQDAKSLDMAKASGMSACKWVRGQFLPMLNAGRSRNLFVDGDAEPTEEIDESEELTEDEEI